LPEWKQIIFHMVNALPLKLFQIIRFGKRMLQWIADQSEF